MNHITYRRVEREAQRVARAYGVAVDILADDPVCGTDHEELLAGHVYLDFRPHLRKQAPALAWRLARLIANAGRPVPVPIPASALLDARRRNGHGR